MDRNDLPSKLDRNIPTSYIVLNVNLGYSKTDIDVHDDTARSGLSTNDFWRWSFLALKISFLIFLMNLIVEINYRGGIIIFAGIWTKNYNVETLVDGPRRGPLKIGIKLKWNTPKPNKLLSRLLYGAIPLFAGVFFLSPQKAVNEESHGVGIS